MFLDIGFSKPDLNDNMAFFGITILKIGILRIVIPVFPLRFFPKRHGFFLTTLRKIFPFAD